MVERYIVIVDAESSILSNSPIKNYELDAFGIRSGASIHYCILYTKGRHPVAPIDGMKSQFVYFYAVDSWVR